MTDAEFAARAVEEARHSRQEPGRIPLFVGAVAAREQELLGTAHRGELKHGEHAEFTLLEGKLQAARLVGATIFTTLAMEARKSASTEKICLLLPSLLVDLPCHSRLSGKAEVQLPQ